MVIDTPEVLASKMINRNMGCIEMIGSAPDLIECDVINRNMGCIEIVERPRARGRGVR